ncbi:hypothetical protein A6J40_12030 [Legionella longbeachae]|uniref:hypothetical protein n=1 Tax=Legionella longbeachae TaxID=450 RepID=UPI0009B75DD0|nr:hypothetical protein [Legionella longbeachae]ARB92860.1 hypothetical protein A6J40_12030 [Legionella longbeachae]RZV26509.1 hypothetical protein EKG34_05050 [Legionella longbeachae]UAK47252.1 hypothetical protein K8O86_03410 [Legionella longbeachae]VEE04317.1 Uncharacterised protein [Legionella oakridgensis]
MKTIVFITMLILSNLVLASSVDSCLEKGNQALHIAEGGYGGTPQSVTECMIIAVDFSKLCQIKLSAMTEAGRHAAMQGGGRISDSWITQEAKRISNC